MDEIFNTDDAKFSKMFLNKSVVCDWDSLLVDFYKATFVYQLTNTFQIRITVQYKNNYYPIKPNISPNKAGYT